MLLESINGITTLISFKIFVPLISITFENVPISVIGKKLLEEKVEISSLISSKSFVGLNLFSSTLKFER